MRNVYFFPLTLAFILGFLFLLLFLFLFVRIGLISYAYERIGVSAQAIFPLLLLSLLGNAINIPIREVPSGPVSSSLPLLLTTPLREPILYFR
jgi:uncharacterized membrane protein